MTSLLVYLSLGSGRERFRNPSNGQIFAKKQNAQQYLMKIDDSIIFSGHPHAAMHYVIIPDEAIRPSQSCLNFSSAKTLRFSEFIQLLLAQKQTPSRPMTRLQSGASLKPILKQTEKKVRFQEPFEAGLIKQLGELRMQIQEQDNVRQREIQQNQQKLDELYAAILKGK